MNPHTVELGAGGFYFSVMETTTYTASIKRVGGGYKRVLRHRGGASVPAGQMDFVWWLARPGTKTENLKVFAFTTSAGLRRSYPRQPKTGYVVATNEGAVRSALIKKYERLVKQYVGMAKDSLTTAMKEVSSATRSNASAGSLVSRTAKAARKVRDLTKVRVSIGGRTAGVRVADDLRYATEALKNGVTVDFALRKAANGVNGMINSYIKTHGRSFFDRGEDFDIQHAPFPEVVGV